MTGTAMTATTMTATAMTTFSHDRLIDIQDRSDVPSADGRSQVVKLMGCRRLGRLAVADSTIIFCGFRPIG
jgi:hypothetical protein